MALTFGSLRHTTSGRKRRPLPRSKRYTPKFQPLEDTDVYRRETPEYKSYDHFADSNTELVERPQLDSKYTIAPAYNKGAYQVISRENVKDIGR
tara:strand:+ start:179 stop:460 length:282 start_codon:yes stop_codon:yes gene_type:complete